MDRSSTADKLKSTSL